MTMKAGWSTEARVRGWYWLGCVGLFLLALAVRWPGAETRPLGYDELYHLLAARSWAEDHALAIAGGEYRRARLYTIATGLCVEAFGWSPGIGRLPAILGGAVQVALLFAWVRGVAGARAGWIAGLLLCFSHDAILTSQFARFYTWHASAVWLFSTTIYSLAIGWRGLSIAARWRRGLIAVVAFLLALHLQDITVIAAAGVAMWLLIGMIVGRTPGLPHRWQRPALLVLACGVLATIALAITMPIIAKALAAFRYGAEWAQAARDRPTFYYSILVGSDGWLLHLLPLAALAACRKAASPALFCCAMLATCLMLHSFAGMKAERYIYYLAPFLIAIWAIAIDAILPWIVAALRSMTASLKAWAGRIVTAALILTIGTCAAIGVPNYRATASDLIDIAHGRPPEADPADLLDEDIDWTPFLPILRPLTRTAMFVTADDLRALHYLGGYDLLLDHTVLWDQTRQEFGRDPRTGGHGISTAASLASVMACYPDGTILVSQRRWRSADVTDETANLIEARATPIILPPALHMLAYAWTTPRQAPAAFCAALRQRIEDRRTLPGGRLVVDHDAGPTPGTR